MSYLTQSPTTHMYPRSRTRYSPPPPLKHEVRRWRFDPKTIFEEQKSKADVIAARKTYELPDSIPDIAPLHRRSTKCGDGFLILRRFLKNRKAKQMSSRQEKHMSCLTQSPTARIPHFFKHSQLSILKLVQQISGIFQILLR